MSLDRETNHYLMAIKHEYSAINVREISDAINIADFFMCIKNT